MFQLANFSTFSLYNEDMSDEDDLTDNISDSMANRSGMKGVKWTKNEDNLLKTLVEQYGEKWDMISAEIKDRSDIQCQQRWTKVVNPELIKGPWTKEVRIHNQYSSTSNDPQHFASTGRRQSS